MEQLSLNNEYWYMFTADVNQQSVSSLITFLHDNRSKNPNAHFTLYISSCGGDIDSAIRFYDYIKASKLNIDTVGFGQVDSSAIILFLTGQKRTAVKNCRFRLHSPTYNNGSQSQNITIVQETSKFIKEIDNRYFQIISEELGLPNKRARNLYDKGDILSTKKALSLKIATAESDNIAFPVDLNSKHE